MINLSEVIETNAMIEKENLDVRTITLGISLLDCMSDDIDAVCRKIYDRITEKAENLSGQVRISRGSTLSRLSTRGSQSHR